MAIPFFVIFRLTDRCKAGLNSKCRRNIFIQYVQKIVTTLHSNLQYKLGQDFLDIQDAEGYE